MKVDGEIIKIKETEVISERFQKREFVLRTDGEYPQEVLFQTAQKKVELLDKFQVGDSVEVDFNLNGRSFQGKNGVTWFNTLQAWKIYKRVDPYSVPVDPSDDDMPF